MGLQDRDDLTLGVKGFLRVDGCQHCLHGRRFMMRW